MPPPLHPRCILISSISSSSSFPQPLLLLLASFSSPPMLCFSSLSAYSWHSSSTAPLPFLSIHLGSSSTSFLPCLFFLSSYPSQISPFLLFFFLLLSCSFCFTCFHPTFPLSSSCPHLVFLLCLLHLLLCVPLLTFTSLPFLPVSSPPFEMTLISVSKV